MSQLTDEQFVRAFLSGAIPPAQFHHRDHLRLTWCLTRQLGSAPAARPISTAIRQFATQHGQAAKYHETLTQAWIRIVGHLVASRPDITEFDAFVAAFPQLLDKELPYRHWRRETMASAAARAGWVEPDLRALPA